jgi:hypothetical protein
LISVKYLQNTLLPATPAHKCNFIIYYTDLISTPKNKPRIMRGKEWKWEQESKRARRRAEESKMRWWGKTDIKKAVVQWKEQYPDQLCSVP